MKHLAAVVLALMLVGPAAGVSAAGPEWNPYEVGLETGKSAGKPIMINFYTERCGWCDRMFKVTYTDRAVADYLNRFFISIKVDADQERDLKMEYEVRGYPTIWFVDPAGEKLGFIPGFVPPVELLSALKYIQTRAYDDMTFEEFLEQGLDEKD